MTSEAAVYKFPARARLLTIFRRSENTIALTVSSYCEIDGKMWQVSNGWVKFDSPEFDNQIMKVAADIFGIESGKMLCLAVEMSDLIEAILRFK